MIITQGIESFHSERSSGRAVTRLRKMTMGFCRKAIGGEVDAMRENDERRAIRTSNSASWRTGSEFSGASAPN